MPISGPALREPPAVSSISEEATDDVSWWRELPGCVQDVYRYRELLYELTLRDLRIRYKQAVMGLLWAIIVPMVVVLAGALFRYAWAGSSGQDVSRAELAGLAIKSLAWSFFVGAMSFATPSLTANLPLVTKVYFPRELLPLSAVLTQVVDSSIGVLALLILLPATGIGSLAGLAWLPLIVTLLVAVTLAAALIASSANVFFRDAKHVTQLVTGFGIFFTPVFYDLAAFGTRGVQLLMLNPLTPLLEGARLALVAGHDLRLPLVNAQGAVVWTPWFLAYSAAWAILGLVISVIAFRRSEADFAEYV